MPQNNLILPETGATPDLSAFIIPEELKITGEDRLTPREISLKVKALLVFVLGAFITVIAGCKEPPRVQTYTDSDYKNCVANKNQLVTRIEDLEKQLKLRVEDLSKKDTELATANDNLKICQDNLKAKEDQEKPQLSEKEEALKKILDETFGTGDRNFLLKNNFFQIINGISKEDTADYETLHSIVEGLKGENMDAGQILKLLGTNSQKDFQDVLSKAEIVIQKLLSQEKDEDTKKDLLLKLSNWTKLIEEAMQSYGKYKNIMDEHPDAYNGIPYSDDNDDGKPDEEDIVNYYKNKPQFVFEKSDDSPKFVYAKFSNPKKHEIHKEYENLDYSEKFIMRLLHKLDKKNLLGLIQKFIGNLEKIIGLGTSEK